MSSGAPGPVEERHERDLLRLFARLLSPVRWSVVVAMLAISVAWPIASRTGYPLWPFVAAFGLYNGGVELLRRWVPRLGSFGWVPYADLPVATLLYYLDAEPGGPLFLGFYVAAATAGATMGLRAALIYSAVLAVAVALVAPTLPLWTGDDVQLRAITSRLFVLVLVAAVTSFMARRLVRGEARAEAARVAAARLAALDGLRSEFVSSVSHELRTPLTAARAGLGMLEMSAGARLLPEESQLLRNAARNVGRLTVLIDDLLAYNQVESGTFRLDRAVVDLGAVARSASEALRPLIEEKGQVLELRLPDDGGPNAQDGQDAQDAQDGPEALRVMGDARRLEQVVVNLLSNAHLHTPAGTRITISGAAEGQVVRLTVSDDGPGIPAEELERIFERFYGLGPAAGSGLGLAIARTIAELHGGTLRAERRGAAGPGGERGAAGTGGTAFRLELPRA